MSEKNTYGLPDGELLPVKALACPCEQGGIGKSEYIIRAMRKAGAPFWGWQSTRNDLLRWIYDNPDFNAKTIYDDHRNTAEAD